MEGIIEVTTAIFIVGVLYFVFKDLTQKKDKKYLIILYFIILISLIIFLFFSSFYGLNTVSLKYLLFGLISVICLFYIFKILKKAEQFPISKNVIESKYEFDNLVFNEIDIESIFTDLTENKIIETDLENFKLLIEQKKTNRKIVLIDKNGGFNKNQQVTYIRLFSFLKDVLIKKGFVYSVGITISEKDPLVQFICLNFVIPKKNGIGNEPLKPKNIVSALRRFNP